MKGFLITLCFAFIAFVGITTPSTSAVQAQAGSSVDTEVKPPDSEIGRRVFDFTIGQIESSKFNAQQLLSVGSEGKLKLDGSDDNTNILYRAIRLIGMLVATLAILLLIVAGYYLMASRGDENLLSKGKKIVGFVIIGLAAVFFSYLIIKFIISVIYSTV